jgi:hypothetical protein
VKKDGCEKILLRLLDAQKPLSALFLNSFEETVIGLWRETLIGFKHTLGHLSDRSSTNQSECDDKTVFHEG